MLLAVGATKKPQRFDPAEIGGRVRKERRKRGLSTEKLAERVAIGADSLYKKQRGVQPWGMDEVSRIAEAFDAPPGWPFIDWDAATMLERQLGRRSRDS